MSLWKRDWTAELINARMQGSLSGLLGMPRRVFTYLPGQPLDTLNLISTVGAFLFAAAVLLFIVDLVRNDLSKVAQLGTVRTLKFDERFIRLWAFYLAYCEAAFDEANIDVVQFTLAKPG